MVNRVGACVGLVVGLAVRLVGMAVGIDVGLGDTVIGFAVVGLTDGLALEGFRVVGFRVGFIVGASVGSISSIPTQPCAKSVQ